MANVDKNILTFVKKLNMVSCLDLIEHAKKNWFEKKGTD
jgi:hypothetical protein